MQSFTFSLNATADSQVATHAANDKTMVQIIAPANRILRLTSIEVDLNQPTAGFGRLMLVRQTTAGTPGGTPPTITPVPFEPQGSAAETPDFTIQAGPPGNAAWSSNPAPTTVTNASVVFATEVPANGGKQNLFGYTLPNGGIEIPKGTRLGIVLNTPTSITPIINVRVVQ